MRQLVARFYAQIPGDDVLGPMYDPRELAAAEKRLADFLIYRTGGPQTYVQERGHPRLRARHAPFAVTPLARDRWWALMERALTEGQWPAAAAEALRGFLQQTATFLINRDDGSDLTPLRIS